MIDLTEFADNALPERLFPIILDLAETVNNTEATADTALQKTGGVMTGTLTCNGGMTVGGNGILYEYNNRIGRVSAAANFQGTYKTSDNNLVYWRNNAAGVEQKINLPLSTFGTTKINTYNTPSPGNVSGILIMSNKVIDTGNEYNTTNGRFTVTISGVYHLTAAVFKNAATETKVTFRKNGVAFGSGASMPVTNNHAMMECTEMVSLVVGDYIEVFVQSGTVVNDYPSNRFSAFIII